MQFAKVLMDSGTKYIPLELSRPSNGATCEKLHEISTATGPVLWRLYSHNGFSNPLTEADKGFFESRNSDGVGWYGEVLADRISAPWDTNGGRLLIDYFSQGSTDKDCNFSSNLEAPPNGFVVPTEDGIFYPSTLVPFETVDNAAEAYWRWGDEIPRGHIPRFSRPPFLKKDETRYVARIYSPAPDASEEIADGRFSIRLGILPGTVDARYFTRGSFHMGDDEVVMEVDIRK